MRPPTICRPEVRDAKAETAFWNCASDGGVRFDRRRRGDQRGGVARRPLPAGQLHGRRGAAAGQGGRRPAGHLPRCDYLPPLGFRFLLPASVDGAARLLDMEGGDLLALCRGVVTSRPLVLLAWVLLPSSCISKQRCQARLLDKEGGDPLATYQGAPGNSPTLDPSPFLHPLVPALAGLS